MQDLTSWNPEPEASPAERLRDGWRAARRHRGLMLLAFVGVFLGAAAAAFLLPPSYVASTRILIKRDRLDALVTADSASVMPQAPALITDMEVNSEVELIRSRDVLQQLAAACGLQSVPGEAGLAAAVRGLQTALKVEPLPKTSLISITYQSRDPRQAARVLNKLFGLYLEKHLAVHQSSGALEFFQTQRQAYEKGLAEAETRLIGFGATKGGVSPDQQKAVMLQKSADFGAEWQQAQAGIAQTRRRIQALEAESAGMPSRLTAQVRQADNPQLMGQLNTTLLNLELKRTELLRKFEPGYGLVREVETEIAQTRQAIEAAGKAQLREETTDRNPTYEWVGAELAKARSELAGMEARAEATRHSLLLYGQDARSLDQKEIQRQNLLRDFKAQEANYFLYLKKEEEARISDALNRSRIVNVALVEPATVPSLPVRSRGFLLLLGLGAAVAASLGAAAAAEFLNPAPRPTVQGLYELLGVPVLAAMGTRELEAGETTRALTSR